MSILFNWKVGLLDYAKGGPIFIYTCMYKIYSKEKYCDGEKVQIRIQQKLHILKSPDSK